MMTAALGWIGTVGTFAAYLLLWKGRVGSESLTYALLNTVGGLLAGTASVLYGAWPSAASNFVWAVIGLQSALVAAGRWPRTPERTPAHTVADAPLTDSARDCLV